MTDEETRERLAEPVPPESIKTREGAFGKDLSYIEAHEVIRELNNLFGPDGWSSSITELRCVESSQLRKNSRGVEQMWASYMARVRLEWLNHTSHEDVGYGTGSGHDRAELAMKEACSDALKRAARMLGERLGNSLYIKPEDAHTSAPPPAKRTYQTGVKKALEAIGETSDSVPLKEGGTWVPGDPIKKLRYKKMTLTVHPDWDGDQDPATHIGPGKVANLQITLANMKRDFGFDDAQMDEAMAPVLSAWDIAHFSLLPWRNQGEIKNMDAFQADADSALKEYKAAQSEDE